MGKKTSIRKPEPQAQQPDCAHAERPRAQTPEFRLNVIRKTGGPLTKRAFLDDQKLVIDSSGCALTSGTARTVTISDGMAGLSRLYQALSPEEAVVLANTDLGQSEREVCTEANFTDRVSKNPEVITRSRRFLPSSTQPGLVLLEVDDHGLPEGSSAPDAGKMREMLDKLLPELGIPGAAQLLTHSTSSHIQDDSGKVLKGEGGKHLTLLISRQSDMSHLREVMDFRQWANGLGAIYITKDGRQIMRTVFDLSVLSPERLVFEAGAQLCDGLVQKRPDPQVTEGHALDMTKLPNLTEEERRKAKAAQSAALAKTKAEATRIREAYLQTEVERLVREHGATDQAAHLSVLHRIEYGLLSDDDELIFSDSHPPEKVRIRDVLSNPNAYIGRPMCDPVEPEYGPSKAMILRGPGGIPFINSFAHGERKYQFARLNSGVGADKHALFAFSDLANAHRIVKAFGNELMATEMGWFTYNGKKWERGDQPAEHRVLNLARLVLQEPEFLSLEEKIRNNRFSSEIEAANTKAQHKAWRNFAQNCENKSKMKTALEIARTLLWRSADELNPDPLLFNVCNGTIDLRTGTLRPHDRDDLITMMADVEFHPDEKAPEFESALMSIFDNDSSVVDFFRRAAGYSLTGLTTEQQILVLWGDGSNGKSTILGVFQEIMGADYCSSAPPKLLEASKSDRHPTEIADLYGRRLVIASETEEGSTLREAFLKLATGSDSMKGRFMHQDFFQFKPTHKFMLQTNHKPEVKGTDYAVWRRLLLVPFEVTFGDARAVESGEATRLKDKNLSEKLANEREGILAWMVRGCLEWRKDGLNPPEKIIAATASYRDEQDRIRQFIEDRLELKIGAELERALLYQAYDRWAKANGYHPLGIGKFNKQLLKACRGKVEMGKSTTGPRKNHSIFKGVKFKPET